MPGPTPVRVRNVTPPKPVRVRPAPPPPPVHEFPVGGDWHLMGTGPSRALHGPVPGCRYATVNSGADHKLDALGIFAHTALNAYGVFEIQAGRHLKGLFSKYVDQPGCLVYTRFHIARMLAYDPHPKIVEVRNDWGPEELKDLQLPVKFAEEGAEPEYGQSQAWISSGVLLLWCLAHFHKPETIYVSGMDGYDTVARVDDYAPGMRVPGFNLDKHKERRDRMNERMSEGIARITQYYTGTRFVWLSTPRHWRSDWRVELPDHSPARVIMEPNKE